MQLFDSHAHLDQIENLDQVILDAKKNNVEGIISVSGDQKSSLKNLEVSSKYSKYVYPCLGFHPWEVSEVSDFSIKYISENIEKCVAVGEIGLDYHYPDVRNSEELKTKQREIYIKLLELADRNDKPCCVHSRGAYKDAFNLAKSYGPDNVVFHWYDGPVKISKEIIEAGFYLSCTYAVSYSSGVRNSMKNTPLEKILLETDAPVYNRKLNRQVLPRDVLLVCEALGKLKNIPVETVAEVTTRNVIRFFDL